MNGKKRLSNILQGKPVDRVSWTTIADNTTRSNMPQEYKALPIYDFYRKIGSDIFQFGGYSMPDNTYAIYPYIIKSEYKHESRLLPNGVYENMRELFGKKLVSYTKNGYPVKYAVQTEQDIELLISMWQSSRFVRITDEKQLAVCSESYQKINESIGGDGIFAPTLEPSPVQDLIENECGVENFYELLSDYPELMERLIDTMYAIRREEYQALAEMTPFECVIPVENTSTALISPKLYRKYSLPHMREFSEIMRKHGKKAIIHMCGHLKHLLPDLKETGMDGIHTLTPPSIGDCPFETALDILGDDLIIIGTLDGGVFQNPYSTYEDIKRCVKNTLTPRIKAANFILLAVADGIPTDVWRFEAVNEAVLDYGAK